MTNRNKLTGNDDDGDEKGWCEIGWQYGWMAKNELTMSTAERLEVSPNKMKCAPRTKGLIRASHRWTGSCKVMWKWQRPEAEMNQTGSEQRRRRKSKRNGCRTLINRSFAHNDKVKRSQANNYAWMAVRTMIESPNWLQLIAINV